MHPSISINSLCFPPGPLSAHVHAVALLGASAFSPTLKDLASTGASEAARLIREAGLGVATLTHRAFGYTTAAQTAVERDRLDRSIDLAAAIGAQSITLTTDGRGALDWSDATARFADAIRPCAERAAAAGVALAVEPTSHLYADVSIAHRLSDLVTIC